MANVDLNRVPVFYHKYITRVKGSSLKEAFSLHTRELSETLDSIPSDQWDFRYAEGKWSVKEVVQHIIDAERIFCYRALCFARKDQTSLPGFDENQYAVHSNASARSKDDLLEEWKAVQKSTELLFRTFNEEQLGQTGTANGNPVYVEGIGFIIIGHALHHLSIVKERYIQ